MTVRHKKSNENLTPANYLLWLERKFIDTKIMNIGGSIEHNHQIFIIHNQYRNIYLEIVISV